MQCFLFQLRQQKHRERMMKNRESASLSRQKKKEYLNGLENDITVLKCENSDLKSDNKLLNEVSYGRKNVFNKIGNFS